MSDQFVGEIRIFGFNFPPTGWALCNGQLMSISQNTALFSLLGTTYGGDGKSTFALPNLQGRAPLQPGQGPGLSLRDLGETGGETNVTLIQSEMPLHTHGPLQASTSAGTQQAPGNAVWGTSQVLRQGVNLYTPNPGSPMNPAAISAAGGSLPHNNLPPYLVLNFCIALQGIFPPRQ